MLGIGVLLLGILFFFNIKIYGLDPANIFGAIIFSLVGLFVISAGIFCCLEERKKEAAEKEKKLRDEVAKKEEEERQKEIERRLLDDDDSWT